MAATTGLDVTLVRVGVVVLALAGVGVAAYVVAWLVLPEVGERHPIGARAISDTMGLALVAALVPVVVVLSLLASAVHAHWLQSLAWPAFVAAAGLVLVWRNGTDADRSLLRRTVAPLAQVAGTGGSGRGLRWRLAVGAALAALGVAALTIGHDSGLRALAGVAAVLAALVVLVGPWWLRLGRELVAERQARLRAEERADVAARVHDSVLQTLALIQHHADQPQRVAHLARVQERELRSWLWSGTPPGTPDDQVTTVAGALGRIQADVEAAHGVPVEVVAVGDAPLTPELEALVAAGREATVNAAKWSGAEVVSLFAEVEPEAVSLFVRDRGRGFDRGQVQPDRHGVSESIEGRMTRVGGRATIRTAPGEGTEVQLVVPRRPPLRRTGT